MKTKFVVYSALSTCFIVVCSLIAIPSVVPITLQTFAIFLISLTFNLKISLVSLTAYLILGIIGLPVFSNFSAGFGVLLGPTGGYLLGFYLLIFSVHLFKKIIQKPYVNALIGGLLGLILLYLFGTAWYLLVYLGESLIGFLSALSVCVLPFIVGDLIKLFLAVAICERLKKIIKIE